MGWRIHFRPAAIIIEMVRVAMHLNAYCLAVNVSPKKIGAHTHTDTRSDNFNNDDALFLPKKYIHFSVCTSE